MSDEILAVTKTYDILMWLIPQIEKFPRAHKFTIGEKMENNLFDLLELLIEARTNPKVCPTQNLTGNKRWL